LEHKEIGSAVTTENGEFLFDNLMVGSYLIKPNKKSPTQYEFSAD